MLIPGVLFITCSAAFKRCVLLDMFQGPHALACSAQVSEQPRSLLLSAPKQAKWLKVGCCVLGCARLGGSATGLCLVVEVLHNYEVECRVVHASLGLPSCFELKDATSSALARGTSGLGAAGADGTQPTASGAVDRAGYGRPTEKANVTEQGSIVLPEVSQ